VNRKKLELMIVAGEPSGDALGAKLVEEIRLIEPDSRFYGAGGPKMSEAGFEADLNIDAWSVTGIIPVALAVPNFLSRLRQIKRLAKERDPDLVILIDFPEFNLKLAKVLKKQGHRIVYYVSPQLWAWRKYRAKTIKTNVDLLLSILPFEKEWYEVRGIENVEYVGNPIVDRVEPTASKHDFCARFELDTYRPIIAMLPGSRSKELRFHVPLMIDAAKLLLSRNSDTQIVFATAGRNQFETIRSAFNDIGESLRSKFFVIDGYTPGVLSVADAAAISSGTATLEAGVIGTPMAIVYKMSKLDAALLGPMVDVEHVGLTNLVAGKRIAKEFIQNEFTAAALAEEITRLLNPEINRAMRDELSQVTERLGSNGSARAAELIVGLVNEDKNKIIS